MLRGTAAADRIYGKAGNDTLIGLGGDDYLNGGPGRDALLLRQRRRQGDRPGGGEGRSGLREGDAPRLRSGVGAEAPRRPRQPVGAVLGGVGFTLAVAGIWAEP